MNQIQPAPATPQDPQQAAEMQKMAMTIKFVRTASVGAANFYWIGAMSILNSVVMLFNGGIYFVVGLAMTLFIDGIASGIADQLPASSTLIHGIALVLDAAIAGIFALFGWLSKRGHNWAFIVGMIVYAIDGLIFLAFQDWLAAGFHLYFMWGLFNGLRALNALKKLNATPAAVGSADAIFSK